MFLYSSTTIAIGKNPNTVTIPTKATGIDINLDGTLKKRLSVLNESILMKFPFIKYFVYFIMSKYNCKINTIQIKLKNKYYTNKIKKIT